jgi:hypothetical protein
MKEGHSLPEIVGGIASWRDYFFAFASQDPLFKPELAAAEMILALIEGGAMDRPTREQVRAVLDAPMGEHYGGPGWSDFVRLAEEWLEGAAELDVGPEK